MMTFERNVWYFGFYPNAKFEDPSYENAATSGITKQDSLYPENILVLWNKSGANDWICYKKEVIFPLLIMFGDPVYE